jgi:hypothetical protein
MSAFTTPLPLPASVLLLSASLNGRRGHLRPRPGSRRYLLARLCSGRGWGPLLRGKRGPEAPGDPMVRVGPARSRRRRRAWLHLSRGPSRDGFSLRRLSRFYLSTGASYAKPPGRSIGCFCLAFQCRYWYEACPGLRNRMCDVNDCGGRSLTRHSFNRDLARSLHN